VIPVTPSVAEPPRRPVESRQPSTGEVWRTYPTATAAEIADAVATARAAQPAWAAVPLGRRMAILRRFHDLVYDRRAEIATTVSRETDKPVVEAFLTEVGVVLDVANWLQREVPGLLRAPWRETVGLGTRRKRVRVTREPFGVVAVITPWNYPFLQVCSRVLPALLAGNTVVFKPSELSPSSGVLLRDLLVEAGIPADACGIVQGDGHTGASLVAAAVDKVCFTGSVAAGRSVARACADRFIPTSLELGGSDAAIVLADADPRHAASGLAWGRFSCAGQTCIAPKRIFVEAPLYDAFVDAMRGVVTTIRTGTGDDVEVGAMIRPAFKATLEAQRDDAIARGARVVATAPATVPSIFPPTVLVDVPDDARAMREETFGPLMVIAKVASADEAVARANASDFGLSGSVWSRDTARAAEIAGRLACGAVAINDVLCTSGIPEVPHGGIGQSGAGRMHGRAGLEEFVRTRGIVADRFATARQAWWFGYSARHRGDVDAFLTFAHARSVVARLRALPAVLRLIFRPDHPL
jgi:acyl-CoA reductase-like NAD-dependent aldehyde dehydrogenase